MADVEMTDAAPKTIKKASGGEGEEKKRFEVKKVCPAHIHPSQAHSTNTHMHSGTQSRSGPGILL